MAFAPVHVVGGGLAGCEAAWQLAERGLDVVLHEMRPARTTPAHTTDQLAELVCSNTFKSTELASAHGLLKAECCALGSLILAAAESVRVPAGTALAVDRTRFAEVVTTRIRAHPRIRVETGEVTAVPSPGIVATGPLTSDALAAWIQARLGSASLAFYDAIAPIVDVESIDANVVFRASRYGKETDGGEAGILARTEGAYLNCPFTRDEYERFVDALLGADQHQGHDFDRVPYFEGCLPIEVIAARGRETLRFGPMKPVGLSDPRTGRRPYAVVQLRAEDRGQRMWNLVGFQTRLRIPEQQRVLRMVPGLERAEFLRPGSIHRNTYLNAPATLSPVLGQRDDPGVLFAGQLTGVEGYTESMATGLVAGINLARIIAGDAPVVPPETTMIGALYRYLRDADPARFQPMNANFGLLDDPPQAPRDRIRKRELIAERALADLASWRDALGIAPMAVTSGA